MGKTPSSGRIFQRRVFQSWCRSFVTLSLISSGLFQLATPLLAAGTPAGTTIKNQATATYEDANTPGVQINTTSNPVEIKVAEVAGLTNVPAGIIDGNGGSVSAGDVLSFDFLITNVGNEATNIFIPGSSNILTQGFNITKVEADLDNNGTFETLFTAGNDFTSTTPILADASVRVRVTGTVTATTAGAPVSVRLGNTGLNDNSAGTQNQGSTNLVSDVRTVPTGAVAPVNGEREASALNATTLATAVTTRALATVLKTRAVYNPQTSATTDDLITYRLDLRVPAAPPVGMSFTVGSLEGNSISINGTTATRILVSDVIPAGTVFDPTFTPTAPANWQVVYSTTDPTVAGNNALAATWTTTQPATAADIKRIGFIYNGEPTFVSTTTPTLTPGTTTETDGNGFRFRVVTTGLTTGGQVANIAQIFGQTVGDPANAIIYDESGDQNPNNYDGTNLGTAFNPTDDRGIANPTVQETDNNNDNTGQGAGGEANVLFIAAPGSILNGPQAQPGAVGPSNSNMTDFTNKSVTDIPAGSADPYNPAPINFINTVQNPATNTSNLDNVVLRPISPTEAKTATGIDAFGANTDLPNGTIVTISLGGQTASYTYDGTNFNLTSAAAIKILSLAPGVSQNYTVTVDLPNSTQLTAFPISIASFVDNNNDGAFTSATEPVFNLTIDRLYTGFVRLVKQFQVLDTDGTTILQAFPAPTVTNQAATVDIKPGQFIQYRIIYSNISTANAGSGNVILNAKNLVITEDGTVAPNNWASVTTNVFNSAADPLGTITYYTGTIPTGANSVDPGAATTGYRDAVSGTLAPGASGTFTFKRRVN